MNNPWVKHVKKVAKTNKIPFSMALVVASPSYKGAPSKTHKGKLDFTTKKGDKVFHQKGKYVHKSRTPYTKVAPKKGAPSKTHNGKLDFTTKKGDKVFHQKGKYVHKLRKPFM
jgi:acetylglutamate synthase